MRWVLTRDHTEGWIEDAYDGELYEDILRRYLAGRTDPALLEALLVWRMSNDPAEMTDNGQSWLPVR
jgi:hypothetical protein